MQRNCVNCNVVLKNRFKIKFCSNKCQHNHQHQLFIQKWKEGFSNGAVGVSARALSMHIRRHLIESSGEKCSECGWNRRNLITGRVPLEIDHVDGNAENNKENNLRVLCPNCHSLTPHFRNLNKGKGRQWRMKKYIKNRAN